jgi:selenocysteine-specific elongation factor
MAHAVVGTAGHIDHGKTALVRALTGIDTDRLPIEKKRGITTELGFAHLELDGRRVAVVDVPGHERFVKSMVAGAAGLDLVMMVIAADEGVMPQTREHLDICRLLGVRDGIVVLAKRDLVDDEWLAMVRSEIDAEIAGTFLAGAPMIAVSAVTGAGLDELRATLATRLAALAPRPGGGVFRLPIDRVFTIKGFGTVATGTIWGGEVAAGDDLVVLPRGLATRARGLEVHGAATPRAVAGQRCAVNLAGVAVSELARGDLLAHPQAIAATHILDVRFEHVAAARAPLPQRTRVLLHHGTAQVLASLHLADPPLPPGATGFGQLRLDAATPIAALPGDRFIVRGFTPLANHGTTIGGGEILRVHGARLRKGAATAAAVDRVKITERSRVEVPAAAAAGISAAAVAQRVGQPAAALAAALAALADAGELVATGDGDAAPWLHAEVVADLEGKALAALDVAPGRALGREELRGRLAAVLPARGFDVVLDGLARRGAIARDGDRVRRDRRDAAPALSPVEIDLLARFDAWGVEPPRPREIAAALGRPEPVVKSALDHLLARRRLVKVKPDLYVAAEVVAQLRQRLLDHLDEHGQITAQGWKELTGTSRKYSIPLAEYFDAEKVTLRVGDIRRRR